MFFFFITKNNVYTECYSFLVLQKGYANYIKMPPYVSNAIYHAKYYHGFSHLFSCQ